MFKHIVIAGGGALTLPFLGALRQLLKSNRIDYSQIQSVYGTSAGGIIAVFLSMKIDIQIIIEYIVNRPWEDLFEINPQNICDLYSEKGLFQHSQLVEIIKPILEYRQITLDVTLTEFYEKTGVELHLFTAELDHFTVIDVSYLTHPNLLLANALSMTCSIPLMFPPFLEGDTYYIDGGLIINYPLQYCVDHLKKHEKYNEEEILGLNLDYSCNLTQTESISQGNIIHYSLFIIKHMILHSNKHIPIPKIPYSINYKTTEDVFTGITNFIQSKEHRIDYIEKGSVLADDFNILIQSTIDKSS